MAKRRTKYGGVLPRGYVWETGPDGKDVVAKDKEAEAEILFIFDLAKKHYKYAYIAREVNLRDNNKYWLYLREHVRRICINRRYAGYLDYPAYITDEEFREINEQK